ncbi:hypothetical protein B0A52_03970 [Exophiala mesophila]|uniref:ABM domain-containing protein n=1 Tax=Exophiala mesophila TaxID=212818 RepID=A0A438N9Y0_EXOME|nr:hypothetical protein B0A52_03970 [Exophiala mesophila]
MSTPATQIIYLTVDPDKDLKDTTTESGKSWSRALDLLQQHIGFQTLYWGRSPEDRSKVQLHVVRAHLSQHYDFVNSSRYPDFLAALPTTPVSTPSSPPLTRHTQLQAFTPSALTRALSPSTPVTGSAIYISTTPTWHEGAWPLWTHVVRYVDGCLGCVGGKVLEKVDGFDNCYIVYVGWESIEKHERYHHTKHFEQRRVILGLGNAGYREYGHIKFEGQRGEMADDDGHRALERL